MRLRILISFHYYKNVDIDALVASFPEPPEIFADSGGFSAYSAGAVVSSGEYIGWLNRWKHLISVYANLDEIGDAEGTARNQQILEDAGLTPIPVFHAGGPTDRLRAYCETYPYVALGGMVPITADLALKWAAGCFKIGRQHGTRFHGFGQTSTKVMRMLPWYSVDSSSWGMAHRFGQLHLWNDRTLTMDHITLGDLRTDPKLRFKMAPLIRAHGGDPAILARPDFSLSKGKDNTVGRAERAYVIAINVTAWLRLEAWLRKHHGPISPPRGYEGNGPRQHLALGPPVQELDAAAHLLDLADDGPKVIFAGDTVARPDLVLAARNVEDDRTGPRMFFAETGLPNLKDAGAARAKIVDEGGGPKMYLAGTSVPDFEKAGQAAGKLTEQELAP